MLNRMDEAMKRYHAMRADCERHTGQWIGDKYWNRDHIYIEGYYCGYAGSYPRDLVDNEDNSTRKQYREEWLMGFEDGEADAHKE